MVVVRMPSDATDDELATLMASLQSAQERGRCALVYDIPRFLMPSAVKRRIIVDSVTETRRLYPGRVVCHAIATTMGPLMHGVVKAVTWLMPSSEPTRVFVSLDEAKAWARAALDAPAVSSEP